MNRFEIFMNKIRDYLKQKKPKIVESFKKFCKWLDATCDNIVRAMIIGIILNVIAASFYPELPERFPVIYGWFDGWLQLGEFIFKSTINFVYAFFTGQLTEFWPKYIDSYYELVEQFKNWLSSIQF